MNRLYQKNELTFSLVWIVAYVVLFSLADGLSADLGTEKLITAPFTLLVVLLLVAFIGKNGLWAKYGLSKVKLDYKPYLYFLPLLVIGSVNLWGGFMPHYTLWESVLYVFSMLCVGFIEEVIFRGFLFRALCKENLKNAMIISSLTFGIGHIVNLLNGAEVLATLLQLCYAMAIGFLFTVIFYKSGNLIPCIITHGVVNALSAFAGQQGDGFDIWVAAILTVVALAYGAWIWRKAPAPKPSQYPAA